MHQYIGKFGRWKATRWTPEPVCRVLSLSLSLFFLWPSFYIGGILIGDKIGIPLCTGLKLLLCCSHSYALITCMLRRVTSMLKIGILQLHPSHKKQICSVYMQCVGGIMVGMYDALTCRFCDITHWKKNNNLLPPQNSCSIVVRVIRQQINLCVPQVLLSGLSIYVAICLVEKRAKGWLDYWQ